VLAASDGGSGGGAVGWALSAHPRKSSKSIVSSRPRMVFRPQWLDFMPGRRAHCERMFISILIRIGRCVP